MPDIGTEKPRLLLDIDGVLHVGEAPLPGAVDALVALRDLTAGIRLITNTTSKPRAAIVERLRRMGFRIAEDEVITPAATALALCSERGFERVLLLVPEGLREDLAGLLEPAPDRRPEAVILGDLGESFTASVLNEAFRALLEGAELVALQHNRYWRSGEGMVMDVGAYAAALEYAADVEAIVVGKPSPQLFEAALCRIPGTGRALMVGDDIEGDIGGALGAGLDAILVRTGKYRSEAVAASGIEPTATIDSIAALPQLLTQ
ncbi:MAG: TIGR01458 family HAD-type hydrolase [Solirubrobacterales bacterium]|nr:TIGR01458 family HAD-type hydrolase [Solirubrobacterales bacterium]